MASKGFGADLWKNVQAVRLQKDGSLTAPVRTHGRDGIAIGVDAVAKTEASAGAESAPPPGMFRRLRDRLFRR